MSLVTCARVGDALTDWLKVASELKKDKLCEALGCGGGMTDEEIAAVFLKCDGTVHLPGDRIPTCEEMDAAITTAIANIFTGGTAGQVWTKRADGTQGWEDGMSSVITADTNTVSFSGSGSAVDPLSADVIVSTDASNALAPVTPGGLFSHTTNLSWDNVAKTITYVNNKGATVTIDLSQFEVDLHVDNATFDPATTLLTLDVAGGTPVQVDLGALAAITTDSTATATLVGNGTVATPLQVTVNLDPAPANRISATAAGLLTLPELPPSAVADDGKVLTVDEDGNPEWATPAAGGDVCAQFAAMVEITAPVLPIKVIVQDADKNCGYINMNNPNFYVDVRTDTKTTIVQAVEDDVTTISFIVRNVGMTDITGLSLVATIPAVTAGSPEFMVGTPTVTNPAGAAYTQTVDTATNKTFEFGTLAAGSTVTFSYPVTLLTKGTYVFASDLVLPAGVIDYSLVDNHSTASVGVREQQPEQPDPVSCPPMNVTVSVNGGPELVPTLVEVTGSVATNMAAAARNNPRFLLLVPAEYGGPEATVTIRTQVPVTLSAYVPTTPTMTNTEGQFVYEGQLYTRGGERLGLLANPLTQPPALRIDVDTNPNNQEFTLRYTPYAGPHDMSPAAQGTAAAVALRPSAECIFQQFAIEFVYPRPEGLLTITGDAPAFTKATEYSNEMFPVTYMDGQVGDLSSTSSTIAEERANFTISSGTGYSFKVVATAPGILGNTPVTGNISIDVISGSEWDVTISPLATAADTQVIGRLHFNVV